MCLIFQKNFFGPIFALINSIKPPSRIQLRGDSKIITRKYDKDMKWIEIITIRMGRGDLESIDSELLLSMADNYLSDSIKKIKIYRHVNMETDLSVHLFWNSGKADSGRSPLAQHLIQFLKEFGLVNHSVWLEEADKNIGVLSG